MGRGSNPGMVEAKSLADGQLVKVGGGEGKRRGAPPFAGIRRGGQRRQRVPRSQSR